jgi:addiction module RelB/DinJ family antitoxin
MSTIISNKNPINRSKNSVINFRTSEKVKKDSTKLLNKMGLDMSTALNLFLNNIIITKTLPMKIVTENGYTPELEDEILRASKDKIGSKTYTNMKDFWADINND